MKIISLWLLLPCCDTFEFCFFSFHMEIFGAFTSKLGLRYIRFNADLGRSLWLVWFPPSAFNAWNLVEGSKFRASFPFKGENVLPNVEMSMCVLLRVLHQKRPDLLLYA